MKCSFISRPRSCEGTGGHSTVGYSCGGLSCLKVEEIEAREHITASLKEDKEDKNKSRRGGCPPFALIKNARAKIKMCEHALS